MEQRAECGRVVLEDGRAKLARAALFDRRCVRSGIPACSLDIRCVVFSGTSTQLPGVHGEERGAGRRLWQECLTEGAGTGSKAVEREVKLASGQLGERVDGRGPRCGRRGWSVSGLEDKQATSDPGGRCCRAGGRALLEVRIPESLSRVAWGGSLESSQAQGGEEGGTKERQWGSGCVRRIC